MSVTTSQPQFGPYLPVRKAGDYYYVSGQVGADINKKAAPTVDAQCHQALQNMSTALKNVGLTMDDVVKTTVFLQNMTDYAAVNEIYVTYFPELRPARTCVEVAALPHVADNALLVEVEAIAYKEAA